MTRERSDSRAALVLAGGRSRRFGDADKAFADLGGTPLVEHVLRAASRVVDGAVVSCRADQLPRLRRTLGRSGVAPAAVPDPTPDRGPAAGVTAGLAPVRAPYTVVLACDTPLVEPAFLRWLFERAAGRDAAVPCVDGRRRPTLAVYRTAAVCEACAASVDAGDGSLRAAVEALDASILPTETVAAATDPATLLDVNTPADLARTRDRSPD